MDNYEHIFARNCIVRRIDKTSADAFLNSNHRLGATGSRYRYGLFTKRRTSTNEIQIEIGSLVAVATFSNARRWKKEENIVSSYEWIRYASLSEIRVIGGMGKLLHAFINEVNPDDIMTYADSQWPDRGQVYLKLGFTQESQMLIANRPVIKYRLQRYSTAYCSQE